MSRIVIPTVEQSSSASKTLLDEVQKQLGVVPNMMKLIGTSSAALEGYLFLNTALGKGVLPIGLRERIALTIAEYNACEYCLSAHSYLAENMAKVETSEISAARDGHSKDQKIEVALQFARLVASQQGKISDQDLNKLRDAGYSEEGIVEIVLNVALNVLTNYINNVAQTDVDFPNVESKKAA
ncbi:carboxymuconolactone decarboxylase family protein [uncultured Desulfuromusa sp.]|uniref:carboxymuconolactone decarboxylase family protein n=1 Tax=uncultured Desulfuromusa sp. TaxID=219183 RepID=UPI002AA905E1|nr:carboxymuconolactone decarboxylase family protein [uncultured Desulfuromusa sp.]